jgi:phosphate transport system substrate-binding protein
LLAGAANFGPMSRPMTRAERARFKEKFGYDPTPLQVAFDGITVYVHKDNPIERLTLSQLAALFAGPSGPAARDVRTWGDLGLGGEWAQEPVTLYGRNGDSGTHAFFRGRVLGDRAYKKSVNERHGSDAVVRGVASNKFGIGYSGAGYKTAGVRAVPLAPDDGAEAVEPLAEYVYTGKYPLARPLYLYVNYKPGTRLDPLRREFIKYVFSKQGQWKVCRAGYFPVSETVAAEALESVGLGRRGAAGAEGR